jgi:hypothetical protein
VGRKEELAEMHRALNRDGSRRISVLYGLGGIGKTQLAAAYAKQHKNCYSAIFWLNTRDKDSLKQSFAKIARQIVREHPSTSQLSRSGSREEDLDEIVDAVKAWLSLPGNTRWLMIYDNYDNPKVPTNTDHAAIDIRRFLPESYQGSVIITTRSSQVTTGHATRITKLENMHDSLEILSNASGGKGLLDGEDFKMNTGNYSSDIARSRCCGARQRARRVSSCVSYRWSVSAPNGSELLRVPSPL